MAKQTPVAEAKARFSECLREAESGQPVVITRYGKAVAALISAQDFIQLRRLQSANASGGLSGLVGRWNDGQDLTAALAGTVVRRRRPRKTQDLED